MSHSYDNIIVAIHGIGKQHRNSTVRSVAAQAAMDYSQRFSKDVSFSYPLGYFHSGIKPASRVHPFGMLGGQSSALQDVGFAEVFWADIPQEVVAERRTLDETKEWGRTVVARARDLWYHDQQSKKGTGTGNSIVPPDFGLASEVLGEILDTIHVVENLSWFTEKAGLLTFDLKEVLDEYLGDVQLVAEFEHYRMNIIGRFHEALSHIHHIQSNARIHIVAHSEGSAIAFMGLLYAVSNYHFAAAKGDQGGFAAIRRKSPPEWLAKVSGFMTIGSPIDKHLLLWPRLWNDFDFEGLASHCGRRDYAPIEWFNYYDHGDPVGFRLDSAELWLSKVEGEAEERAIEKAEKAKLKAPASFAHPAGQRLFTFDGKQDIGFSRYVLPGAAHNGYWDDPAVFGHFLGTVVLKSQGANAAGNPNLPPMAAPPEPRTKWWVKLLSGPLPYVLSGVIHLLAAYLFLSVVLNYYLPSPDPVQNYVFFMTTGLRPLDPSFDTWEVVKECLGWGLLLFTMTVAVSIPRLAPRLWYWLFLGAFMGLPAALLVDGRILRMGLPEWFVRDLGLLGMGADCAVRVLLWFASFVVILFAYCIRSDVATHRDRKIKQAYARGIAAAWARYRYDLPGWLKGPRPLLLIGLPVIAVLAALPGWQDAKKNFSSEQAVQMVWDIAHGTPPEDAGAAALPEAPSPADPAAVQKQMDDAAAVFASHPPVWPVVVTWTVFGYLWWLGVLIFDLAFVWHRYVRSEVALDNLRKQRGLFKQPSGANRAGGRKKG